jgi:hypothetical protein
MAFMIRPGPDDEVTPNRRRSNHLLSQMLPTLLASVITTAAHLSAGLTPASVAGWIHAVDELPTWIKWLTIHALMS